MLLHMTSEGVSRSTLLSIGFAGCGSWGKLPPEPGFFLHGSATEQLDVIRTGFYLHCETCIPPT